MHGKAASTSVTVLQMQGGPASTIHRDCQPMLNHQSRLRLGCDVQEVTNISYTHTQVCIGSHSERCACAAWNSLAWLPAQISCVGLTTTPTHVTFSSLCALDSTESTVSLLALGSTTSAVTTALVALRPLIKRPNTAALLRPQGRKVICRCDAWPDRQ